MEVNYHLLTLAALLQGKYSPLLLGSDVKWTSGPVWRIWRRELLVSVWNRTSNPWLCSLQLSHNIEWAIRQSNVRRNVHIFKPFRQNRLLLMRGSVVKNTTRW